MIIASVRNGTAYPLHTDDIFYNIYKENEVIK